MKLRILIASLLTGIIAYAGMSTGKTGAFSQANDFPRGALIYVQFSNLPELIKLWNDSELKAKYTQTQNFKELSNRHLGLKLASRWQEFNDAAGFPFDLAALTGFADQKAAVAVYEIGRLDFVFIAPVSDALFAATKMMQSGTRFEEEEWKNGIRIFRVKVDADRGRQKQELLFAHEKGRLVIATSEKLLVRTISNLNGTSRKDRLGDEPAFSILSQRIAPHAATVWANQTALNEDYYFRRYWLMGDPNRLKNIRAGMFDFSIEDGKMVETRDFILNESRHHPSLSKAERRSALAHVPENLLFHRLRAGSPEAVDEAVTSTISVNAEPPLQRRPKRNFRYPRFDFDSDDTRGVFSNLSGRFDERIDEGEAADATLGTRDIDIEFSRILRPTNPKTVLTLTRPGFLPAPMFAEFKRAAVFRLASPARFSRDLFESAIERSISAQVRIATSDPTFRWETKSENELACRRLSLPMLGWSVSYCIVEDELFLANDEEFLREVVKGRDDEFGDIGDIAASEVTVLNLEEWDSHSGPLFERLAEPDKSSDFFTGNIESLLNLSPRTAKIKLTRSFSPNALHEELTVDSR